MKDVVVGLGVLLVVAAGGFYAGGIMSARYTVVGLGNGGVVRIDTRTGESWEAFPVVPQRTGNSLADSVMKSLDAAQWERIKDATPAR